MRLMIYSLAFFGLAQSAMSKEPSADRAPDPPLSEVTYFHSSPPVPGILYGRHMAALGGILNIKDGCLRIGNSIPRLDHELIFNEDENGLYLRHIYDDHKYRMGDTVSGGGGGFGAKPGQSMDGCTPEQPHGYFMTFHMGIYPPAGRRTDCPFGRYDRGDGLCVPYPGVINCPKGTVQLEDGICVEALP